MTKYKSPLRYPGGKTQIKKYVEKVIEDNNITNCIYIEPFCGGAGLGLKLLFDNKIKKLILNDKDKGIYCFWENVLENTNKFIEKIKKTSINISEFERQKYILENKEKFNNFDIGFAAFLVNRCSISGILKAGPIGGIKQNGKYKVNARFGKEELIRKIIEISRLRNKIEIYNLDIFDFLKKVKRRRNKKNLLIYLDPPYFKNGKELYVEYFEEKDHINLSNILKKEKKINWLLSYDYENFIEKLYENFNKEELDFKYFTKQFKEKKEFIFSNNLTLKVHI